MLKKLLLKCRLKPLQVSIQLDLVVLLHPVVKRRHDLLDVSPYVELVTKVMEGLQR